MQHDKDLIKIVGYNVKKRRVELGLSQQVFADNIDVAKSTIQRIETGKYNASISLLVKLSNGLNTDVINLLTAEKFSSETEEM